MNDETLNKELAKVQRNIDRTTKRLNELNTQKANLQAQTEVLCPECKTTHMIKDLTYIQTHWYTRPSGCMEGDYWNEGEGQFDCPSCDTRLRLYKRKDLMDLRGLFKDVVKEYKD